MTQEDKELLLKDLCARLPYGVVCTDNRHGDSRIALIDINLSSKAISVYYWDFDVYGDIEYCKPYLRPMSSMTEEEMSELSNLNSGLVFRKNIIKNIILDVYYKTDAIDWLNAHHFDYRGLIEKGLAIEVTKENNPYEN